MKKNSLKFLLALMLVFFAISMVACTNLPPDTTTPDQNQGEDPLPVTFTVTFDSKGGTGIEGYKDIEFGQTVPAPTTNPTKAGYVFDCWTLSNGDAVDFSKYTIYANTTFYASWKAKSYDITAYLTDEKLKDNILDFTSGTVSEYYGENVTVEEGEKYNLRNTEVDGVSVKTLTFSLQYESTNTSGQSLPVPTAKEGDRFMYWYYYEGDQIVQLSKTYAKGSSDKIIALNKGYNYDGSRTIYAMWYSSLENITVKFNSGIENESISTPDVVLKDGDYVEEPEVPTLHGYDFKKWTYFKRENGEFVLDDDDNKIALDMDFYLSPTSQGVQVTSEIAENGVFNLYANWTMRIEIASAGDFANLDSTSEAVQNANIYLTANVDLGEWTAKFDDDNPFKGVFDGKGHTVTYTISSLTGKYASLIGVNEGTIKSLSVNATINLTIDENNTENQIFVGGVAGKSTKYIGAVDVTSFVANVSATSKTVYVGGVVALNHGGDVKSSKSTVVGITVSGADVYAGGAIGTNNSGAVDHFIHQGNIAITGTGNNVYVGGLAGKITAGDYTECAVNGANLSATATSNAYVGGLAGKINNNNSTKISITGATLNANGKNACVGGVAGEGGSTIKHANVTDLVATAEGSASAVVGGFVGSNFCEVVPRGLIQYSVVRGALTAISTDGKIYAGGISGQQNAGASSTNGAVSYTYSECSITAITTGEANLGSAFGIYDAKTICTNVYVADNKDITLNDVVYNKESSLFEVTTRTDVEGVTPGFETIQNASWINGKLKLNATSSSDNLNWVVADGSYPTLTFAA